MLADLLASQGQADEAIAIRRELLRLRPDDMGAAVHLVKLLLRYHRRDEARSALARWLNRWRAETSRAVSHLKLGLASMLLNDKTNGLAELSEAARLDPTNPWINHELGHARLLEHDLAGAIEAYRNVIKVAAEHVVDSNTMNCRYELAFAHCLSGDHWGEIAALRDAIRIAFTLNERQGPGEPVYPTGEFDDSTGSKGERSAAPITYSGPTSSTISIRVTSPSEPRSVKAGICLARLPNTEKRSAMAKAISSGAISTWERAPHTGTRGRRILIATWASL
jgi:tetratricopeptide (TPR) repeat protein